jgi:hypothetical protein
VSAKKEELGTLSKSNFREFAKRAIAQYEKKDLIVDALLWSAIIGHYEAAIKKAAAPDMLTALDQLQNAALEADILLRRDRTIDPTVQRNLSNAIAKARLAMRKAGTL